MSAFDNFHPAVREWFTRKFTSPTAAQLAGWDAIAEGRDTLVAAPTGSGKTLAAFLSTIDALFREGTGHVASAAGGPPAVDSSEEDAPSTSIQIVYVSPLKALSSDIQRNLEAPLIEIGDVAREMGLEPPQIKTALRTGDTTQAARAAILRDVPHILITTPESLYLMLTAERARNLLTGVRTVIVDELHALMRDKRGSHLMLTLARLDALCDATGSRRPVRVGLSATVHPIEDAARYLVGTKKIDLTPESTARRETSAASGSAPTVEAVKDVDEYGEILDRREKGNRTESDYHLIGGDPECTIVDVGHRRDLDLAVEVPPTDLEAIAPAEQWADIYDRVTELIAEHRTTLVFVNTRRLAERVAHQLQLRLGEEHVAAHHGVFQRKDASKWRRGSRTAKCGPS